MSQSWQRFILEQSMRDPKLRNSLSQSYLLQGNFAKAAEAREIEDELLYGPTEESGGPEEEMSEEEAQALQALEEAAQMQDTDGVPGDFAEDYDEELEDDGSGADGEMSEDDLQALEMLAQAEQSQTEDESSLEEEYDDGESETETEVDSEDEEIDPEELSEEEIEQMLMMQGQ